MPPLKSSSSTQQADAGWKGEVQQGNDLDRESVSPGRRGGAKAEGLGWGGRERKRLLGPSWGSVSLWAEGRGPFPGVPSSAPVQDTPREVQSESEQDTSPLVPAFCWIRAGHSLLNLLFQCQQHWCSILGDCVWSCTPKHPEGPECGDVTATPAGLPVSPNPGHPFAPCRSSPSPSRQGADPEEPLTFVGEAKARGLLLPCPAAAQLLQEEAEQERGQGQPGARGSPHGGTGSAGPHSTMVQRRDAASNTGCEQRRGKLHLSSLEQCKNSCAWDTLLPSTPCELQHIPCPGQLFQPAMGRCVG